MTPFVPKIIRLFCSIILCDYDWHPQERNPWLHTCILNDILHTTFVLAQWVLQRIVQNHLDGRASSTAKPLAPVPTSLNHSARPWAKTSMHALINSHEKIRHCKFLLVSSNIEAKKWTRQIYQNWVHQALNWESAHHISDVKLATLSYSLTRSPSFLLVHCPKLVLVVANQWRNASSKMAD